MGFLFEVIWEFILEFLVAAPGAFILWAVKGFKGRYIDFLRGKFNKSTALGISFWLSLLALAVVVAKVRS